MDDLIKRQDAIDAMCSACGHDCNKSEFVYNAPQDEQVIMCPEHYALSTLPSAEPAQKTGKWMWVQYDANPEIGNWHCSECKFMPSAFNLAKKHLNYCPNCGARMVGEEE